MSALRRASTNSIWTTPRSKINDQSWTGETVEVAENAFCHQKYDRSRVTKMKCNGKSKERIQEMFHEKQGERERVILT